MPRIRLLNCVISFLLVFIVLKTRAQEPIGLISDRYLPATSVLYNPALIASSPLTLDINLLSADASAYNNAFYVNHLSLFSLLGKNLKNDSVNYSKPSYLHFFSSATIQGPSATYKAGPYFFGITTAFRTAESFVSKKTSANLDLINLFEDSLYPFPSLKTAGLAWMQMGFTLGTVSKMGGILNLATAVSINYLGGFDGIAITTHQPTDFVLKRDSISYSNLEMNYGASEGFRTDVPNGLTDFKLNGSGFSFNLGACLSNGDPLHESWRLAVSLNDLGLISFARNIDRYSFSQFEVTGVSDQEVQNIKNSQNIYNLASINSNVTQQTGALKISLPTSFTLQGEVALTEQFFLNALLVQQITLSDQQVQHANMLAVTPRYETKKIGAGLPLVWNNYDFFQLGGYFRFRSIIVGSNDLEALFIPSKWRGADFYVGVHLFLNKINEPPDRLKCSSL